MRATVRETPWAFAARQAMMFTSSELLAATSRSELLIPASLSSLGLAPLPAITSASSSSVACSTSFSSFSTSTTLWPSWESMRAVLSPTSPAPMITVCKAGNLLRTVGLYEWGSIQGLLGSSDHEHVPVVQYGVAAGQGPAPQADYHELPDHRPPTWIAGRRSGFGSASRSTSWVTGAVSPSPKRM